MSPFEECLVSARVDNTASCSADITKRVPTRTSVLLPPLNTGPTKEAIVATSCQVFCCPEQTPISCVLCHLFFVGHLPRPKDRLSRQVSRLEDRQCVSLCSLVQLRHGDIQDIQPFLHSSLAAHHSNALPFVVAGEVVQDRVEEGHGYCCYHQGHTRRCSVLTCSAFTSAMVYPGAGALGCLDRRRYRSGCRSLPFKRGELTLLTNTALAACAVGGDGV